LRPGSFALYIADAADDEQIHAVQVRRPGYGIDDAPYRICDGFGVLLIVQHKHEFIAAVARDTVFQPESPVIFKCAEDHVLYAPPVVQVRDRFEDNAAADKLLGSITGQCQTAAADEFHSPVAIDFAAVDHALEIRQQAGMT
jgi:hypothetical protein